MRPSVAAPPRDRAAVLAAALALLLLAGAPASGQETVPQTVPAPNPGAEGAPAAGPSPLPDTLAGAAGTWDLALAGGQRRCVLTLATDSGPSGRLVRFPAGCRRALPLLAGITGWLFTEAGIRLVDANARPVLAFARSPDGQSLGASAENGERYSLVPLQIAAMRPPEPAAPPAAAPEAGAPAQVAAPPPEGPVPGLYALDRAAERDVCRIELSPPAADTKAYAAAQLLPGCRDSGMTVFDPAGWRFAGGHMTLKARRGHAVNLVALGDGRWRRDPDIGFTLVLRKVEP